VKSYLLDFKALLLQILCLSLSFCLVLRCWGRCLCNRLIIDIHSGRHFEGYDMTVGNSFSVPQPSSLCELAVSKLRLNVINHSAYTVCASKTLRNATVFTGCAIIYGINYHSFQFQKLKYSRFHSLFTAYKTKLTA
jgi:hypothetical protein